MRFVLGGCLIVMLIVSCGLTFRYGRDASFAREELNVERYKRLTLEENLQRTNLENSSLKAEVTRLQKKYESADLALKRTISINEDLKDRLDRAAEIQKSLDRRIADLQKIASPL